MKKTSLFNLPSSLLFGSQKWLFPVLILWISFVFIFFFVKLYAGWDGFANFFSSSPFSPPSADFSKRLNVWKESFLGLATGFLVMGILWSYGKRLFHWLSLEAPPATRFCLEIGLGIFLLNTFWLGLGLTRLWMEPLWLAGFVFSTFLFLKDLLKLYRKGIAIVSPKSINLWLALICGFYFVFLLLHSLLPETFFDSLNYFLGMPSFWLWHHGICDYPTHLLSGYFHGGSLFFMNGFVLAETEGAKVLAALVLLWIALACYGWAKELAGPKAGAVAATAVMTFPLLYLNSWAVRVDGLLTFVLLPFLYALEKGGSLKKGGRNWIVIAGIFAGLALSIKPTAIVTIGAALIALLWRDGFEIFKRKGWMIFAGILLLEIGPWLLKNACFAGNTFFPYAISRMGGRSFPVWSQERLLHENQQFLPMDHGILSVLSLPWRFTMPGAGDDQFIGPLLLAFLPLLLLLRFKNPSLKFLARTLLLSFVLGLTLSHMLRFSIPAFVLVFLVLSVTLTFLKDGRLKLLWTGAIVLSALLCFGQYFSLSATQYDGWGIWSGKESHQGYLSRNISAVDQRGSADNQLIHWINGNLPKDARLFVVGDSQVLYFPRQVYANSVFDEQFFAIAARNEKDSEGILRKLKELGIAYLIINERLGRRNSREYHQYELSRDQWRRMDDFVHRGLEPLSSSNLGILYHVKENLGKFEPRISNPFLYFSPQAMNFFQDLTNKNQQKAILDLEELIKCFPGEKFLISKQDQLINGQKT